MAFTYASPPSTPKDEVRFWSGDTTEIAQSVTDEDIAYLLTPPVFDGNVRVVAAQVCRMIGDKFAALGQMNIKRVGPYQTGTDGPEKAAVWYAKAERLLSGSFDGSVVMVGPMFTGGPAPVFEIGMQDNGFRQSSDAAKNATGVPELGG
jgi:hypothetical protein